MSASFEEKSVWIQLIGTAVSLGAYFVVAATMLAAGVTTIGAFVPLFAVAVVLLVAMLVAGHVLVAVASRRLSGPDERDRLVEWRAESGSAWLLAAGAFFAIAGLVAAVDAVWIAHLLLVSLFASTVLKYALQIRYYRRGL